jgi:uncharacterized protein (DUF488 family)
MMQTAEMRGTVFTLGHSNLEAEDFLALLLEPNVRILCDVRSRPGSFRFPQFNREPLEALLATAKIKYEFFGEALGGRPADRSAYRANGLVDYAARRKAPDFCAGVERTIELSRAAHMALMCAEEDPLHCHRFLMICPALLEGGITPIHIRRGGILESQRNAEDRLLNLQGFGDVTTDSLFPVDRGPALMDALRKQSEEYAFHASPETIHHF